MSRGHAGAVPFGADRAPGEAAIAPPPREPVGTIKYGREFGSGSVKGPAMEIIRI